MRESHGPFQPVGAGEAADLEAVGEVLRGNTEAYRLIAERYKDMLYRLSVSYLGNHEDAEECTQDILMRAYRYLDRFSLQRRFLPWLYGIAVNHLRTAYARKRRREARRRSWLRVAEPEEGVDPQAILEEDQSREAVRSAVISLPANLREPMVLYYFEEMSVARIAEVFQISEVNVKSRLFRGRRRLRRILEQDATPDDRE